jgi:hypothetical protein
MSVFSAAPAGFGMAVEQVKTNISVKNARQV